ncbi:hypothetical protein [Anaerocellum danielii]|uniref:Uncharacterized protein n=1 Tax=Anaerocellum danielii TaxID=1387557 RepID=A0ABZ0U3D0_9FIRM|nr:hypothetical protein [Caldicellulosiruptor danielii]WPX08760.1 hypothetical protein SOJ16_002670 [Caldicellulosiruptor danielii]
MQENNLICPKCGSKNVLEILYGYPDYKAFEEAEKGNIILGGCCISDNSPDFHCKDCNYEWKKEK